MRLSRLSKVKQQINDGATILTWVRQTAKLTFFPHRHAAWRTGSIILPYTKRSCTGPKILQGSQTSEPHFQNQTTLGERIPETHTTTPLSRPVADITNLLQCHFLHLWQPQQINQETYVPSLAGVLAQPQGKERSTC